MSKILNGKKITFAGYFSYGNLVIWVDKVQYRLTPEELIKILSHHKFIKTMKREYEHLTLVK
jgi:hypothetical protein